MVKVHGELYDIFHKINKITKVTLHKKGFEKVYVS